MPVTLTFNTFEEKTPLHNEEIIWLKGAGTFDHYGFEPHVVTVEYHWEDNNGTGICYNGEDYIEGFDLKIILDGEFAEPTTLWCYPDEWWKALEVCDGN